MSSSRPKPWETHGYSDIVAAALDADELHVSFANGDEVTVPLTRLGLDGVVKVELPEENATEIVVRGAQIEGDLDWMQIRAATDPAFAKELRRQDTEESKRLGRRLRALREDRGLRQGDVAELVGMTAPQLSKIEKGETDLRLSTIRSLLRAMNASFADVAGDDAPEVSHRQIIRSAVAQGVPKDLTARLLATVPRREVAALWKQLFGQELSELMAGAPAAPPALAYSFKARQDQTPEVSPLLHLALNVADLLVRSLPVRAVTWPTDPAVARSPLLAGGKTVSLEALMRGAWQAGIIVLPLTAAGGFTAVAATIDARAVVVIKDKRAEQPYWLFDLAHELGHHVLGHVGNAALIDFDPPSPEDRDDQEHAANQYALKLLMPEHDALVTEVRSRAQGPRAHLRFKFVVQDVADEHGADAALLAMLCAYELTDVAEPKDRWGSANNLAREQPPAAEVAHRVFSEFVELAAFDGWNAEVLRKLLTE